MRRKSLLHRLTLGLLIAVMMTPAEPAHRNVSITLRHFGEKFRLQEEAQRPLPTAAVGG
jgi:hypothetical protein